MSSNDLHNQQEAAKKTERPYWFASHHQRIDEHIARGEFTKAIEECSFLLNIYHDGRTFKKRGYLYAITQHLEKALADFDESIRLYKFDATTYNYRSAVKLLLNQKESAKTDIENAIKLDPSILSVLTTEQLDLLEDYE